MPTRNRPGKLAHAVASIIRATRAYNGPGELLLIDQTARPAPVACDEGTHFKVRHILHEGVGVSRARNVGIHLALNEFVVFTDDDCVVAPTWVAEMVAALESGTERVVFGYTKAMPHPHANYRHEVSRGRFGWDWHGVAENGDRCFATITRHGRISFLRPCLPYAQFGSSNNFGARRVVFQDHGYFSPLFGAGAVGASAEDTEWQYRLLRRRERIAYDSRAVVQHDNWLSPTAATRQLAQYTTGTLALFLGHALNGDAFAFGCFRQILLDNCIRPSLNLSPGVALLWRALRDGCRNGAMLAEHLRRLIRNPIAELARERQPQRESFAEAVR